ncbi:MAG: ABC transporter permease subunit [Acidimicrobiia bacterium]|nr:ABC transporter permease subunit [Acidimicrobiia bacterium]
MDRSDMLDAGPADEPSVPLGLDPGRGFLRGLADTRATGVLLLIVLGVVWELSVRLGWVEAMSWPLLSEVLVELARGIAGGEIVTAFAPSVQRLAISYVIASVIAVGLGLLMGYFRSMFNLFEPLVESLRPIPMPAYIPVAILFLGIDDAMKIFMVAIAAFFPILVNTYTGVRSIDPIQIQTGRTFGLSTAAIVRQIVIPASSPYVFAGLRISLGTAFIVTVIAEMIVSNDGIGFYIINAQRTFRVVEMYAGIIALGIFGYLLNRAFTAVEKRVLRWHYGSMA